MSEVAAQGGGEARKPNPANKKADSKPGLFARIARFWRQVVAELRKVVRPTRDEVGTYPSVVLVFVLLVMGFIALVDFGFGQVTFWLFGI